MAKISFKNIIEKLRFRYKLSLLNENTLGEVWFIRLSRLRVFLLVFLVFVVFFILSAFLLLETPLSKFTPGHRDSEMKAALMKEVVRTDSLMTELQRQQEYIDVIKGLMIGDIEIDSVITFDSLRVRTNSENSFIDKTDREKEFVENFENEEKYNLSVVDVNTNNGEIFFPFPPTNGIVSERFQLKKHYGIDIKTVPNETVVAIMDGTVVFTGYTLDEAYVMQIQHANNLISIYKSNAELFKKEGDIVKSGESIAITNGQLHFELWRDGKPLNPESFIIF